MFEKIIDFIKDIINRPWESIFKAIVMIFVILISWKYYQGDLKIYKPMDLIEFTKKQGKEVDVVINNLLKKDHINVVAVIIYQPQGVPKNQVELKYAESVSMGYEEIIDLPFVTKARALSEDTEVYNLLQYREVIVIDGSDYNHIGKIIKKTPNVEHVVIYGLYKYGSPYGAVIIAHDTAFDPECEYVDEFMGVSIIQDILFR